MERLGMCCPASQGTINVKWSSSLRQDWLVLLLIGRESQSPYPPCFSDIMPALAKWVSAAANRRAVSVVVQGSKNKDGLLVKYSFQLSVLAQTNPTAITLMMNKFLVLYLTKLTIVVVSSHSKICHGYQVL
jgi:hypothetical protein